MRPLYEQWTIADEPHPDLPVLGHGARFYGKRWVELICIKLDESTAFVGGQTFEKPAAGAATAALKAEREAVQLWDLRQVGEFKPAAHLPHLPHLPPSGPLQG